LFCTSWRKRVSFIGRPWEHTRGGTNRRGVELLQCVRFPIIKRPPRGDIYTTLSTHITCIYIIWNSYYYYIIYLSAEAIDEDVVVVAMAQWYNNLYITYSTLSYNNIIISVYYYIVVVARIGGIPGHGFYL